MARSWSLHQTLSLGGSLTPARVGFVAQNDAHDTVYFFSEDGTKIWSYDGSTLTDISGATFTSGNEKVYDLCWFKEDLYCLYRYETTNNKIKVAKWGGGQSWSDVLTPSHSEGDPGGEDGRIMPGVAAYVDYLDADETRIVAAPFVIVGSAYRQVTWASTDGSNWVEQEVTGNFNNIPDMAVRMFGLSKGSTYSGVLWNENSGGDDPPTEYSTGVTWVKKSSAEDGKHVFRGYATSLQFFYAWHASATYYQYLVKSTDWLSTSPAQASAMTLNAYHNWLKIQTVGIDAFMMADRSTYNAYTYSTVSGQFEYDGTMSNSNHHVLAYFRIGATLYALCKSHNTGEAKIYDGGSVDTGEPAKYYEGDDSGLVEISDLPFDEIATPDAMAVSAAGLVAIGSGEAGQPDMIVTSGTGDNWQGIDDEVGNVFTERITSLRFNRPCAPIVGAPTGGISLPTNTGEIISLPPGQAGQVPISNGPDQPPAWGDARGNVTPKAGKCNIDDTEYDTYSAMMADLDGSGEQGLVGSGAFTSAGEQLPAGDHLQGRGIGVSVVTKASGTYALDIRGACTIQDIEYVISGGNVCVAKTAGGQANLTNVKATVTPDTGDDVGFLCSSGTLIMRNCEVGYSGGLPEYSIEVDGASAFIVVLGGYFSGSVRAKNGGIVWLIGSQIQGGIVEQTGGTVEGLYFTGTDLFFIGDLISSGGADIKLLGFGKLLLDVDSDSYIEALVDDIIKMFVAGSESGRFNTSGLALPQGKEISLQGAAGGPQSSTARNLIEKIGHILDGGHPANPYPSTRDDDDAEFNNSEQSENNTIGTHAGGDSWEWSPGVPSHVSINGTIDSHLYVSKAAGDSGTDRALLLDISSIGEDDGRKFELFVTSLPKTNKTGNVFSIKLTDTTSGKYIRLKMDDDSSNGMQIVATYDTGGGETTSATIAIGHPIGPAAIALGRYTFGSDAYGRFYFGLEGSPAAEHLHHGNDYFAIINMGAKADYIPDDFRLEWSNVSFFTTVIDSVRIT